MLDFIDNAMCYFAILQHNHNLFFFLNNSKFEIQILHL